MYVLIFKWIIMWTSPDLKKYWSYIDKSVLNDRDHCYTSLDFLHKVGQVLCDGVNLLAVVECN